MYRRSRVAQAHAVRQRASLAGIRGGYAPQAHLRPDRTSRCSCTRQKAASSRAATPVAEDRRCRRCGPGPATLIAARATAAAPRLHLVPACPSPSTRDCAGRKGGNSRARKGCAACWLGGRGAVPLGSGWRLRPPAAPLPSCQCVLIHVGAAHQRVATSTLSAGHPESVAPPAPQRPAGKALRPKARSPGTESGGSKLGAPLRRASSRFTANKSAAPCAKTRRRLHWERQAERKREIVEKCCICPPGPSRRPSAPFGSRLVI